MEHDELYSRHTDYTGERISGDIGGYTPARQAKDLDRFLDDMAETDCTEGREHYPRSDETIAEMQARHMPKAIQFAKSNDNQDVLARRIAFALVQAELIGIRDGLRQAQDAIIATIGKPETESK